MSDWPPGQVLLPHTGIISVTSALEGVQALNPGSGAWPAANRAFFIPFRLDRPQTVYKMAAGAGVTAGSNNFDIGIYDASGVKIVSSGATAKGNSVEHIVDVTDTVIGPGLFYLAMSADGTGNYIRAANGIQVGRLSGLLQMDTAYTLPATATFAAYATDFIPMVAAYLRPY